MMEQTTARNVPADDLPEVMDMLLEHLGLRLMVERTPDYTAYELQPPGVPALIPFAAKEKGIVAGDGQPCPNDHDPDCRWPDCNCRHPWPRNPGLPGNERKGE